MLARSKLNSIESKINEALENNEIKHGYFHTIIDEKKKHQELKENIRMMNSQRSDAEKIKLIEEDKKIGINEVIDNSLNHKFGIYIHIKMKSFCLKCKKVTENINSRVSKTSNNRTTILSKCAKWGSKKSRFIKRQEVKGLLSNLGIRTPLNRVPI